jgi:hypothetical protein
MEMESKFVVVKLAILQICINLSCNMVESMENNIVNGLIPVLNELIFKDAQSFLTFASAVILIFTKSLKLVYAVMFWGQVLRRKIKLTLKTLKQNIENMENEKENEN